MSRRISIFRYTVQQPNAFSVQLRAGTNRPFLTQPPDPEIRLEPGEGLATDSSRVYATSNEYAKVEWRHTGVVIQGAEGVAMFQWSAEVEVQ